jgi:hypothetical protein
MGMSEARRKPRLPSFVVLRETRTGTWKFLAQVRRKPGLGAQAARTQAILEATRGRAKAGEAYAAILASEWRVAQRWNSPAD